MRGRCWLVLRVSNRHSLILPRVELRQDARSQQGGGNVPEPQHNQGSPKQEAYLDATS